MLKMYGPETILTPHSEAMRLVSSTSWFIIQMTELSLVQGHTVSGKTGFTKGGCSSEAGLSLQSSRAPCSTVTTWFHTTVGHPWALELVFIVNPLTFAITASCSPWQCSSPMPLAQTEPHTCKAAAEWRWRQRQSPVSKRWGSNQPLPCFPPFRPYCSWSYRSHTYPTSRC